MQSLASCRAYVDIFSSGGIFQGSLSIDESSDDAFVNFGWIKFEVLPNKTSVYFDKVFNSFLGMLDKCIVRC